MNYCEGFYHTTLQNSERRMINSMASEKRLSWSKVRKALKLVALYQADISLIR